MYQGQDTEVIIRIVNSLGEPVLGLSHTGITAKYWNNGMEAFQSFAPTAEQVQELERGFYVIKLPKELFPNIGTFYIEFTGLFETVSRETEVTHSPISMLQNPSVCVVSGNIMTITGQPSHEKEEISFRVANPPSNVGGALVSAERVIVYPDAYGNFSVQLLRFAEIVVEIKRIGINYKFTVPDQATAMLISLIPSN